MEFLASLAIKALIGTSICGTVTVGAVYGYDKTLLGFRDNVQKESGSQDGDDSAKEGGEKTGGEGVTTSDATPTDAGRTATSSATPQDPKTKSETGENENIKTNNIAGAKNTILSQPDTTDAEESVIKTEEELKSSENGAGADDADTETIPNENKGSDSDSVTQILTPVAESNLEVSHAQTVASIAGTGLETSPS